MTDEPLGIAIPSESPPSPQGGLALSTMRYGELTLLLVLGAVGFVCWRAWVTDDAFITFRHVANCLAGHGPVFNPGQRVQGFSHPLWFLLLLAGGLVFDVYAVAVGLGLLFTALIVVLMAWLLRGGPHDLIRLAGFVVVLLGSNTFVEFQTAGLECSLTSFLIVALWGWLASRSCLGLAPKVTGAAWLCALLLLTRPDHLILCAPVLLGLTIHVIRRRGSGGQDPGLSDGGQDVRPTRYGRSEDKKNGGQDAHPPRGRQQWLGLLSAGLPLLAWYGFALVYYGTPLPNTAYAKVAFSLPVAATKGAAYAADFAQHEPFHALLILATLFYGLFDACRGLRDRRAGAGMMLCLVTGLWFHLAYVFCIGGDFMRGRFFLPLIVGSAVLVTHWAGRLLRARDLSRRVTLVLAVGGMAACFLQPRHGEILGGLPRSLDLMQYAAFSHPGVAIPAAVVYLLFVLTGMRSLRRGSRARGERVFLALVVVDTAFIMGLIGYLQPPWGAIGGLAAALGVSAYCAGLFAAGRAVVRPVAMILAGLAIAGAASLCDLKDRYLKINWKIGIADEYSWYAARRFHNPLREPVLVRPRSGTEWMYLGDCARRYASEHGPFAVAVGAIGIFAYHAGPEVRVIDWCGLTDPFIARGGAPPESRVGHVDYEVPEDYLRMLGAINLLPDWQNRLIAGDPKLADEMAAIRRSAQWVDEDARHGWEQSREVVSGDLFSRQRWRLIPGYAFPRKRTIAPWPPGTMPREIYWPSLEIALPKSYRTHSPRGADWAE